MADLAAARRAGRRFGRRSAHRAARQRALRSPDMYTDEVGEVHPIRDSPGYDPLEERAAERTRTVRRRQEEHEQAYHAGAQLADAQQAYRELQGAILSEGGIRANADYASRDIPRDVYRANGKPADEMAQVLETHGFHYDGDVEMMSDLRKRRRQLERLGVLQRA